MAQASHAATQSPTRASASNVSPKITLCINKHWTIAILVMTQQTINVGMGTPLMDRYARISMLKPVIRHNKTIPTMSTSVIRSAIEEIN